MVIGATSKWQSDGRNTVLAHGHPVDDSDCRGRCALGRRRRGRAEIRARGFLTVLTTRTEANAAPLAKAIREQGGDCMIVELDLVSEDSIASAFATIRREAGDPEVLIYNAGIWKAAICRRRRSCSNTCRSRCSIPGCTSPPEGLSSWPRKYCRRCARTAGVVLLLQQLELAARQQADDRPVAVLPAGDDAYPGAGADRGLLRAWRARRQHSHRWLDRFAGQPELPRNQNRREFIINPVKIAEAYLVSAHPGPVVLDARTAADAVSRPSPATDSASQRILTRSGSNGKPLGTSGRRRRGRRARG